MQPVQVTSPNMDMSVAGLGALKALFTVGLVHSLTLERIDEMLFLLVTMMRKNWFVRDWCRSTNK